MTSEDRFCCHCGDPGAAQYWGPAISLDRQYWLGQDCKDSILYMWIVEHHSLILKFEHERSTQR